MAGYQSVDTIYQLSFEDEPGMTVACRGTTMGQLLKMSKLQVKIDPANPDLTLFKMFKRKLVTWNLAHDAIDSDVDDDDDESIEDDNPACDICGLRQGDPLPTSVKGLFCVDSKLLQKIIVGWMQAVAGVSDPKGPNLNSGEQTTQEDLMSELGNLQSPLK